MAHIYLAAGLRLNSVVECETANVTISIHYRRHVELAYLDDEASPHAELSSLSLSSSLETPPFMSCERVSDSKKVKTGAVPLRPSARVA